MPMLAPGANARPSISSGRSTASSRLRVTSTAPSAGERQEHAKFVSAQSGNGVGLAQVGLKPESDLFQDNVTLVMPECVVHVLEAIEIHEQQREWTAVATCGSQGLLHANEACRGAPRAQGRVRTACASWTW
jgi:hypothetical protein